MEPTSHPDAAALPRYRCHKEVSAARIIRVHPRRDGGVLLELDGVGLLAPCEPDMVRRYMPIAGDYLVVYDGDGYCSISPRKPFEDGYTRL